MKHFIELYRELDLTTSTLRKRKLLASFFKSNDKQDLLWTIYLLSGRFRKRPAGGAKLRAWAAEAADIPEWLMQETYQVVGDLSETIANILPQHKDTGTEESLSDLMKNLIRLKGDDVGLKNLFCVSGTKTNTGGALFSTN
jgi:DNA ligase 1